MPARDDDDDDNLYAGCEWDSTDELLRLHDQHNGDEYTRVSHVARNREASTEMAHTGPARHLTSTRGDESCIRPRRFPSPVNPKARRGMAQRSTPAILEVA